MGGGASSLQVSVPDDLKPALHASMQLNASKEWANAEDLQGEEALRAELKRLRQLAMACLNVKHDNKVVVDRLDVNNYKLKKVEKPKAAEDQIMQVMKTNNLFKRCKEDDMVELLGNFEEKSFSDNEVIMKQGDSGDHFYVIADGKCVVDVEGNGTVATLNAGMGFGELALMYNTPRAATITAKGKVLTYAIGRSEYRLVLAHRNKQRAESYKKLLEEVVLKSSSGKEKKLIDALTDEQLAKLVDAMDDEDVEAKTPIITQGEKGDTFYIIADGEVEIIKDGQVLTKIGKGKYFGERALISDELRAATCVASCKCKVLAVDREDFVTLLGSIDELVDTDQKALESAAAEAADVPTQDTKKENLMSKDIDVIRTLGQGAFGRVKMVKAKVSGEHYALKAQSKVAIVENSLEEHVLMERDILNSLDHPFILKLVGSYQDDYYIFFVLELLIGGELFTYLRKMRTFQEPTMKFYVAGVILGFEHMHAKKIAYRDLKPENLVLDKFGYCKIVDLGLAKVVQTKTWTLCGTPDYLAPEIILNEGHDKAVDYWALGVLMFELVAGMPPFYADDPMASYEKILSSNMKFPSHFRKYLSDCIRKLLKLCQSKRLGNGKGGCGAIKKHRFFSGFSWEDLLAKRADKLKPPIDINVKDDGDASNFDKYDEEVEKVTAVKEWKPADIPFDG